MAGIQLRKFGYKGLTLHKDTVKRLQAGYRRFQKDSGKPLRNYPTMSDFIDLALTLTGTPKDRLPRLILVSKSRWRTVVFDVKAWRPVVLGRDKAGDISSTRVQDFELYKTFCKRVNPAMFEGTK